MKRFMSVLLSGLLLLPLSLSERVSASSEISFTITVNGTNTNITSSSVVIFPNDTDRPLVINSSDYNFRNSFLMIFDKNGKLIEAGGELLANADGTNGSPQLTVTIPSGGFMVGFGSAADKRLKECYDTAFEGAMLYNSTMSIIYDVNGAYDPQNGSLSISYDLPKPVTEDTVRFLIVGNSATYFNGTPLKFKALCREAGLDVSVTYCTYGSSNLSQFADPKHSYGSALRRMLKNNKFDFVVLQDAGRATGEATDSALETLIPLIRENGAKPLLYMRYADSSSKEKRPSENVNHYNTYTTLAEKYDTIAAPAAVAYYYCQQDGIDIELYADDLSHHSSAGSYLIACTWLRAFMGVSPVGNTYTANLDPETVKTLQNIALRSCDEPFEPEKIKPAVFVDEDGVEYINVAFEKPYKVNGSPYSGDWTDTNENGDPIGKWTDGIHSTSGSDTAIGCWKGSTVEAVIDLGELVSVKRVTTDLFGGTWGVPDPADARVQFFVSDDGKSFSLFGDGVAADGNGVGGWTRLVFGYTADKPVNAQYVKVVYKIGGNFCWVSEIEAFGGAVQNDDDISEVSDGEESAEPVSDLLEESDISETSDDSSCDVTESDAPSEQGNTGKILLAAFAGIALIGGVALMIFKRKK